MTAKKAAKTIATGKSTPAGNRKRRILLVDDHPMLRQGLAQVVNQQPDLVVCGEAGDSGTAMQCVAATKPDLAVVDISLEGRSGLELIKDLRALHPEVPILVMSMHDETLYAERVLRAGARGYVMKKSGGEAVLQAIRRVLNGQVHVSESMSSQILDHFTGAGSAKGHSPMGTLTDREFEVFKFIGDGCSTREIARRLHLSPKTVDVHRQNLKAKLKLPNATSLVQHAVRWVEAQSRS